MDIPRRELEDARNGCLYFLGNIKVERSLSVDLGLVGAFGLDICRAPAKRNY